MYPNFVVFSVMGVFLGLASWAPKHFA